MTFRGSRFFPLDRVRFRHGPSNGKELEGTVLNQLKRGTVILVCGTLPGKVRIHPSCVTYLGDSEFKARWRDNFPAEAKQESDYRKGEASEPI